MAKVIGFAPKVMKQCTCWECGAVIEYAPNEPKSNGQTDEGVPIKGITCPNCHEFKRTNP